MPRIINKLSAHLDPRNWAAAARRPGAYGRGLFAVVLAYVVVVGWLLAFTKGMPYVLDNNETFSSLIHARNIAHFGVRQTFGLTDETYGLEAAQHPYVYTHGGNFPRLYTLLWYLLGARTAEAQILVTTFTIGLAGLLLAYHFFSRVTNPLFALWYCLLLITDYVMQTQWLVNTWRTWHHFFVFSSLLCVHALVRKRRKLRWVAAATALNFACLAYFEIVFATYVGLLAALYAALLVGWQRPGRILRSWLPIGIGVALGATVLAAQVVGYLGWGGFLQDARQTFLARNVAPEDVWAFRGQVWSFVEEHHLVFWDNFVGAGSAQLSSVFRWCLLTYTPMLVFVATLLATAWALSLLPAFVPVVAASASRRSWSTHSAIPWATAAAVLYVCATLLDLSFAGLAEGRTVLRNVIVVVAGLGTCGVGRVVHRRLSARRGNGGVAASRIVAAAALLTGFAMLARYQPPLYGEGLALAPLFQKVIVSTGGTTVWHLAALGAAAVAVSLLLAPRPLMGRERRSVGRLFHFLVAGAVATVAVFRVFPGYVMSGYLTRYCPLTIYLHLVPFAAAFYVLTRMSVSSLAPQLGPHPEEMQAPSTPRLPARLHHVISASALLLLCLLSGYWLVLQASWVAMLDPRETMPREVRKPQYRGASFVVNNYAAPAASGTTGWAYADGVIGTSELRTIEGKFYLRRDFRYLWLADKRSNRSYFEPDYFMCWYHTKLIYGGPKCQDERLVAEARAGTSLLGNREVARDRSGRDQWSIVKLNWTYPPGSGRKIEWHGRQFWRTLALPE